MSRPLAYFDNAATTKPMPVAGVQRLTENLWANPGSPHPLGALSRDRLQLAKKQIAQCFGLAGADNVIEVCSATEAINLVLNGTWDLIVSTGVEHEATLRTLQNSKKDTLLLPNLSDGRVDVAGSLPVVDKAVRNRKRNILLSVIYANNEIGTVQATDDLLALRDALQRGGNNKVWVHLDIVQAVGHVPISLAEAGNLAFVDFASISAHKWHGPPGVGFLLTKASSMLRPLMYGGAQQGGLRPGTEHCALVTQAAFVLRHILQRLPERMAYMKAHSTLVRTALQPFVDQGMVMITGHADQRSVNHVSFCVANCESAQIIEKFNRCGVCISSGSACSGAKGLPSHVLLACAVPAPFLHGAIRITCSVLTTDTEVARLCRVLRLVLGPLLAERMN